MTGTEINEGVRSMTTSTVPSESRTARTNRVGLPRVEVGGHDVRAAESVAYGYGFGESMRAEKNAADAWVLGEDRDTGSALRPCADDQHVDFFVHKLVIRQSGPEDFRNEETNPVNLGRAPCV